jgi:ubiquinol-cytochrome c reductase cytochrome b subunit
VIAFLSNWLDSRTGYRKLISALLIEEIPGGAKWRYVWGSCLAFVFSVQLITGVLLMTSYSAGDTTAWGSVHFIQYEMDFGWLIRGLHHFGSQTMVVLLAIHMLQVVIAGAHLPPREVNWWLGLALLGTVLALSLTGYLLPWDQKGYWATKVATNIAGNLPVFGPQLSKIIVGGPDYGNHTLTRFYALHVGILPPLVIVLIIAHIVVFRRHGVTAPANTVGEGWFWPDQAFRDMVASMAIFAVMMGLVLYGFSHKIETQPPAVAEGEEAPAERSLWDKAAHAGRDGKGANLDAPADPATKSYPARPEWYFLFLFQLLKYFEGSQELVGTVIIPNGAIILLAVLPLLAFGRKAKGGIRTLAHVVGLLVVVALIGGAAYLTYEAVAYDRPPPELSDEQVKALPEKEKKDYDRRKSFHESQQLADDLADRAIYLADKGIPPGGAVLLLRNDPKTQGPGLFKENCFICHSYGNEFTDGKKVVHKASDLAGFGTEEWIRGLLRDPGNPGYFGRTGLSKMTNWVAKTRAKAKKSKKKGKEAELDADFDVVAKWLAGHPRGAEPAETEDSEFARGYRVFERLECKSCHTYGGKGAGLAPDLTGYGDADWLRLMLMRPYSPMRYDISNRMPAFLDTEGVTKGVIDADLLHVRRLWSKADKDEAEITEASKQMPLSDLNRELIIRWLLNDNRVVFGGQPIKGPKRER